MDIESKIYRVRSIGGGLVEITQKPSGISRTIERVALPSDAELAAMSERRFDLACRIAFIAAR